MTQRIGPAALARLLGDWRGTPDRSGPAHARLAAGLQTLVLDGRLPVAARLPAERETAAALGLSRTTVTAAYDRLRADGYLRSRTGAGSWTALPPAATGTRARRSWPGASAVDLDLTVAAPSPPRDALAAAAVEAAARLPGVLDGHGYEPAGLHVLRTAIAHRYTARGLPTGTDEILVTAGAQGAFDLVVRDLVTPGDPVAVDTPTYPGALAVLDRARARLVPVGVSVEGRDPELFAAAVRQSRLAYVHADFANPTGALLDEAGRRQLVAAARAAHARLVVDETLVDLGLDRDPPPPVAAFDRDGGVVSLGSLSKSVWGGLRIGWVRASPVTVARLAEVRATVDLAPPVLEQLVAVALLRDLDVLLVERRATLRAQRAQLHEALRAALPSWRVPLPPGGLSLWVELDAPCSTALSRAAERHGVRIAPGPRFGLDGTLERFLRLPYVLPGADLVEAVARLARARADLDPPTRVLPAVT